MKGAVLLLAIFATECYCDDDHHHCVRSSDCGENQFCFEGGLPHDGYYMGHRYCLKCPSKENVNDGLDCDTIFAFPSTPPELLIRNEQECRSVCPDVSTSEYIIFNLNKWRNSLVSHVFCGKIV